MDRGGRASEEATIASDFRGRAGGLNIYGGFYPRVNGVRHIRVLFAVFEKKSHKKKCPQKSHKKKRPRVTIKHLKALYLGVQFRPNVLILVQTEAV